MPSPDWWADPPAPGQLPGNLGQSIPGRAAAKVAALPDQPSSRNANRGQRFTAALAYFNWPQRSRVRGNRRWATVAPLIARKRFRQKFGAQAAAVTAGPVDVQSHEGQPATLCSIPSWSTKRAGMPSAESQLGARRPRMIDAVLNVLAARQVLAATLTLRHNGSADVPVRGSTM